MNHTCSVHLLCMARGSFSIENTMFLQQPRTGFVERTFHIFTLKCKNEVSCNVQQNHTMPQSPTHWCFTVLSQRASFGFDIKKTFTFSVILKVGLAIAEQKMTVVTVSFLKITPTANDHFGVREERVKPALTHCLFLASHLAHVEIHVDSC